MKMGHLQTITFATITYFSNHIKTAETLVNTEFPLHFITERAGIRTPDNLIKSQVLYHLSYTPLFNLFVFRQTKCPEPESNQRHEDFQSSALPTELSGHVHVSFRSRVPTSRTLFFRSRRYRLYSQITLSFQASLKANLICSCTL